MKFHFAEILVCKILFDFFCFVLRNSKLCKVGTLFCKSSKKIARDFMRSFNWAESTSKKQEGVELNVEKNFWWRRELFVVFYFLDSKFPCLCFFGTVLCALC